MSSNTKGDNRGFLQRAVEQFAALCDMPHSKILLAVSGGADSSVMFRATLEFKKQYPLIAGELAVAHVNFHLRGEDSDSDENFVRQIAEAEGVKFLCKEADTTSYARRNGLSVEMAAREIRYNWFYELADTEGFTHLAIAHNANDNMETLLLNLVRGTSLQGLCAIQKRREITLPHGGGLQVIRPLLWAERIEIEEFAIENDIKYVTDKTNLRNEFARNKIRNVVTPVLKQINPSVIRTVNRDIENFSLASDALSDFIKEIAERIKDENGSFPISSIQRERHGRFFLMTLFKEHNFTLSAAQDACDIVFPPEAARPQTPVEPKIFRSSTHTAAIERGFLKIYDNALLERPNTLIINELPQAGQAPQEYNFGIFKLTITTLSKADDLGIVRNNTRNTLNTIYLDVDKIKLPLTVRTLSQGDRFSPFGLKGSKKVVDFLNDRKVDMLLKEIVPIVADGSGADGSGKIVAIAGYEIDESVKIDNTTKAVLQIEKKMLPLQPIKPRGRAVGSSSGS